MPIKQFEDQLCLVRLELSPAEISELLAKHVHNYPGASALEAAGAALVQKGFDPASSADFVQHVCEWGRGHRFMGRVRDNNSPEEVSIALSEGVALAQQGEVPAAVERIRRLRNLGQSFASKQLRFLEPDRAVILDSVIRNQVGYPETADGYAEFLADCHAMLSVVRKSGQLGREQAAALRVCDIEATIFAKIQGY